MNDDTLIADLRAALDRMAARAPMPHPDAPPPPHGLVTPPQRRRRSAGARLGIVAAVAAAITVVVTVVGSAAVHREVHVGGPERTAPASPTTDPTPPVPPAPLLPKLLPGPAGVVLRQIADYEPAGAVAEQVPGSIYLQDFAAASGPAPARLVVTTEVAPAGSLVDYASNAWRTSVGPATAYLVTSSTHLQLLWQVPDGVVVSLEAINLSRSQLLEVGHALRVAPGGTGVVVTAPLPAGLTQTGQGGIDQDGLLSSSDPNYLIGYRQDGCEAVLQVVEGRLGDADAIAISAGNGISTTVGGQAGVEIHWTEDPGLVTVIWVLRPASGTLPPILARLQGSCDDIPALAATLRPVDAHTWAAAIHALGPRGSVVTGAPGTAPATSAPPAPLGQAAPTMFGIAH